MAAGPGLLLALALSAGGVDVEAGLTAGARARSVQTGGAPWQHTLELVALPNVALRAERPGWSASATYAPRLTAPDVLTGAPVDGWQELALEALWRASPTLELGGAASGAIGTSSLLSDTWRTTGPDPVRTADRVDHFAVRAGLSAEARLARGTTLTAAAAWSRGGGSDDASRIVLPVEEELRLDARLEWAVSRVDELEARLSASDTRLDTSARATLLVLTGRWRRQLDHALHGWVTAGGGLVAAETPAGPEPRRGTFVAEAGLEHALPPLDYLQRLTLRGSPAVDRLLGTVDPRLAGEYLGTYGHLPGWRIRGRIVAAMTRRAPGTDHLALAEAWLERGVVRDLTARVGVQGSRQRSTDPALPALVEWIAQAGFEWRPSRRLTRAPPPRTTP